jgi:hypothetical protein
MNFQDVPESVKILDCNNVSETLPMHVGLTAVVFKGIYKGRSVAVKVFHASNHNEYLRVSSIVLLDPRGEFF